MNNPLTSDYTLALIKITSPLRQLAAVAFLLAALALPAVSSATQIATLPASNITPATAVLNASVNPGGVNTVVSFQYGPTTNYGSATFATPLGAGVVPIAFSATIAGLTLGNTYHFRITTTAGGGTNGADATFVASLFGGVTTALPSVGASAVAIGDFDGDGKLDVLLTGDDTNFLISAQVFRNTGTNIFTNLHTALPGVSSSAVAVGDLDNDGHPDIILTGFAGSDLVTHFPIFVTQAWHNNGDGTFANLNLALPGVDTGAVALEDYDNDGRLDLLLTGSASTGAVAQIWHNNGNNNFVNINAPLPGVFYSAVAWADFDTNGNPGFVLTGTTTGFITDTISQIWRNNGHGAFVNLNVPLPGVSRGAVAWGDFDGDGRPDLLISGLTAAGPITQIWHNNGNGTFANANITLPGVSQGAVAVGDFDNDGKLDLLITGLDANTNAIAQLFRNLGNNTFAAVPTGLPGVSQGTAAFVDLNNTGRLDILVTGFNTNSVPVLALFRNTTSATNTNTVHLANVTMLTNGFARVNFKAADGRSYRVQATATPGNAASWTALGSTTTFSPGHQQFSDPAATNLPTRFYRVTTP